jgi:hypothetical protein
MKLLPKRAAEKQLVDATSAEYRMLRTLSDLLANLLAQLCQKGQVSGQVLPIAHRSIHT